MSYKPLSLRDVATLLGVKPYQVSYALAVGLVPEPSMRMLNKRVFLAEDVERLARHFDCPWKPNEDI